MRINQMLFAIVAMSPTVSYPMDRVDFVDIYMEVESAYLSKDVAKLSKVLSDEYLFTSIVFVEEKLQTSRVQTKSELLSNFERSSNVENNSGPSDVLSIQISKSSDYAFCGKSIVESPIDLSGQKYKEVEEREICFIKSDSVYKAVKHRLEYIYRRVIP